MGRNRGGGAKVVCCVRDGRRKGHERTFEGCSRDLPNNDNFYFVDVFVDE